MITLEIRAVMPDSECIRDELGWVEERWPRSMTNLSNMGIGDGKLIVSEDWRLLFEFHNGTTLLWHENTRQWETIWETVRKK